MFDRSSVWPVMGLLLLVPALVVPACSAGVTEDDSKTTATATSAASTGAAGAGGGSGGQGQGGTSNQCAVDCSTIQTPPCQVAECNTDTLTCDLRPMADASPCDDSEFCTVNDTCLAGLCEGGPANDCGMMPGPCTDVACNEMTQNCSQQLKTNGTMCQDPNDLCTNGASCTNGNCLGGTPTDCFFFPVPNECHVPACNPMTGLCQAVIGNNGQPCNDPTDLCTVNKTCAMGACSGGTPKDCSALSQGCLLGVCNTMNGQCTTQMQMNGQPCNDQNPCTTGETCQMSMCSGGMAVTTCMNGDGCCPMGCTFSTDTDCCTSHSLVTSYTSNNNFNGNMFDVTTLTAVRVTGFSMNLGTGTHTVEVYYRAGTWVGFDTSSTGWTLAGTVSGVVSSGDDVPTVVPLTLNIPIPANQTYAFYVTNTGTVCNYINGTNVGQVYAQDANIQVREGAGKEYPFLSTFTPRVFSGTVRYDRCM